MPRGPRLDAPEALHHVIIRGLERRVIFRDARDRQAFVDRVEAVTQATDLTVLAWALLPNHAHLLVRTSPRPTPAGRGTLATAMRRLLTGYAGAFNRRYRRSGHLFQNRYKSILVEEEPYFLELARYIHLNPFRAGLVKHLDGLDTYPWSGHSALLGEVPRPWQAVAEVLGSGPFVESVRREVERASALIPRARAGAALGLLIERVATIWHVMQAEITGGSRRRPLPAARAAVCALATTHLGLPASAVARALGISLPSALVAGARGRAILQAREAEMQALLRSLKKDLA